MVTPARPIALIGSFRDDPFEPYLAGVFGEQLPILGYMFAVADRTACGDVIDKKRQSRFSVDEACSSQVHPIEVEQIEGVVDHPVHPTGLQILLKR
ncbi:MAG: hypothetical protein K0S56_89 [Microvirga sp.]|nr:hypothetical protein [Microvirga sp.]